MISIVTILILLACVILAFFILIQNPKGGGLSGSFGTMSSQVMGVKQSTDVMEKGTWTMISVIACLCIFSVMLLSKPAGSSTSKASKAATSTNTSKKGK
jgi:preprotein translocase subunit SecG